MAVTWKVLDADGASFIVKYTNDDLKTTTVLQMVWDGATPVDQWLSGVYPFPPPPPPSLPTGVDTSQYVGNTGTASHPLSPKPSA